MVAAGAPHRGVASISPASRRRHETCQRTVHRFEASSDRQRDAKIVALVDRMDKVGMHNGTPSHGEPQPTQILPGNLFREWRRYGLKLNVGEDFITLLLCSFPSLHEVSPPDSMASILIISRLSRSRQVMDE